MVSVTRLATVLSMIVRDRLREVLHETHNCEVTRCKKNPRSITANTVLREDNACIRIVSTVLTLEDAGQGIIFASQALQEPETDTHFSYVFQHRGAVTVVAVFLVRQFVRFPNEIRSNSTEIQNVYTNLHAACPACLSVCCGLFQRLLRLLEHAVPIVEIDGGTIVVSYVCMTIDFDEVHPVHQQVGAEGDGPQAVEYSDIRRSWRQPHSSPLTRLKKAKRNPALVALSNANPKRRLTVDSARELPHYLPSLPLSRCQDRPKEAENDTATTISICTE
ncbi:unnamed protein product [Dibothriocephalus latus]|uniref:Uncharacterized protein n=1 Tax=Dibothriocephalus latus TaxID=60516 RepID=A0A3P7PP69_DIBLA|nr:unnamed protein product [Dibothriocephalus latus]